MTPERMNAMLNPARALLEQIDFWKHQGDGLACFLADGWFRTFRLPMPVRDRVAVAGRFCIVPLLPFISGDGKFFVLALSQNGMRLLQCTRFGLQRLQVE